jgi:hypothetical protein
MQTTFLDVVHNSHKWQWAAPFNAVTMLPEAKLTINGFCCSRCFAFAHMQGGGCTAQI